MLKILPIIPSKVSSHFFIPVSDLTALLEYLNVLSIF